MRLLSFVASISGHIVLLVLAAAFYISLSVESDRVQIQFDDENMSASSSTKTTPLHPNILDLAKGDRSKLDSWPEKVGVVTESRLLEIAMKTDGSFTGLPAY